MSEISIKSPNPWLKSHTSSESLETKDLTPPKKKNTEPEASPLVATHLVL